MTVGAGVPLMGYDSYLGLAKESTWGTLSDNFTFVEFNSESIKKTHEEILLESINGTRNYKKRMSGNIEVTGSLDLDCNVASDAVNYIIYQAMGGTVTCSTITASVYQHVFSWGDMENNKRGTGSASAADLKGLSLQMRKGGFGSHTGPAIFNARGGRVNNLTIKGEIGRPVVMTADMVFKGMTITSSTPTAAFSDIKPLFFDSVNVYFADSITNAVPTEEIYQNFELTINNNLVSDAGARELGSRQLSIGPPPTRMDVKLKLMQRFDTLTAYNRWIGNTMCAIHIRCISSTYITASTTSGTTYTMYIALPACYLNNPMTEIGGPEMLNQTLEFSCILETMTSYPVQITVTNGTENY